MFYTGAEPREQIHNMGNQGQCGEVWLLTPDSKELCANLHCDGTVKQAETKEKEMLKY